VNKSNLDDWQKLIFNLCQSPTRRASKAAKATGDWQQVVGGDRKFYATAVRVEKLGSFVRGSLRLAIWQFFVR
jgi:hypothetical protein